MFQKNLDRKLIANAVKIMKLKLLLNSMSCMVYVHPVLCAQYFLLKLVFVNWSLTICVDCGCVHENIRSKVLQYCIV